MEAIHPRLLPRSSAVKGSFLKWVGGKTRTAAAIAAMAPPDYERYFEPFMGSAAVFFALEPRDAVLCDLNAELATCFREVKRDPEAVISAVDQLRNTKQEFLRIRAQRPDTLTDLERAARVIYLNKTAFRGIWRVNRRGEFNVPYGEYDRPMYKREQVLTASRLLQAAEVRHGHFLEGLMGVTPDDWVYLDPPYVPAGGYADFKRYTPGQFRERDHEHLAETCHLLDRQGVRFLLTNTNNDATRSLYRDFDQRVLATRRDVNMNGTDRGSFDLVVSNYELPAPLQLFAA